MRFISWLRAKEKRFAWSLVGTLIGVLSLLLTIEVSRERKAGITFTVTNEANVYDIHTRLAGLRVLFQGQDLEEQSLTLKSLTIRIQNTGGVDILQNHFDVQDPWGVAIAGSRIIEARVAETSTEYLKSHVSPRWVDDRITLSKVIFERGTMIVLDVLLVHQRAQYLTIRPFGKIAGIDDFEVIRALSSEPRLSFLKSTFHGSAGVQAVRVLAYPVLLILFTAALVGVLALVTTPFHRLTRNRRLREVAPLLSHVQNEGHRRFLQQLYVGGGLRAIVRLKELLEDQKRLKERVRAVYTMRNLRSLATTRPMVDELHEVWENDRLLVNHPIISLVDNLVTEDLIKMVTGEEIVVSDGLLADVQSTLKGEAG
jgi:hypothetical protein